MGRSMQCTCPHGLVFASATVPPSREGIPNRALSKTQFSNDSPQPRNFPARHPQMKSSLRRLRIALVDDHAVVREGYRRLLEFEPDMEVVSDYADGASLEAALGRGSSVDVVVLDLSRPGLSGIALLRRLRQGWLDVRRSAVRDHERPRVRRPRQDEVATTTSRPRRTRARGSSSPCARARGSSGPCLVPSRL